MPCGAGLLAGSVDLRVDVSDPHTRSQVRETGEKVGRRHHTEIQVKRGDREVAVDAANEEHQEGRRLFLDLHVVGSTGLGIRSAITNHADLCEAQSQQVGSLCVDLSPSD